MKHAQKYRYFSLLMGLVLLLSACQIGATTKNDNQAATKEATVELNRTTTPTLFFHGYAGTKIRLARYCIAWRNKVPQLKN